MEMTPKTSSKLPFALLDGLFDYAGLFPPASLPMQAAVDEYLRHRRGPEAALVGPFVVPVARLSEAEEAFRDASASLTALSRPGGQLPADLKECRLLAERTGGRLQTRALEMPIPLDVLAGSAEAFVAGIQRDVSESGLSIDAVYLELLRSEGYTRHLDPYFSALKTSTTNPGVPVRGKLRFGGAGPDAYPTPMEVALFIDAACRQDHPFKATAGLHHPFRHQTAEAGITMHGFINVFVGAAIHREHGLDIDILSELIDERDPEAFVVRDTGIRWRSWTVSAAALAALRQELAVGIGSCSIQEPLDDLARLHYLIFQNPT